MSDTLITMYVQEIARLSHRAITAEARIVELEAKLEEKDGVRTDAVA